MFFRRLTVFIVAVSLSGCTAAAQDSTREPAVPIIEETPGLLRRATFSPDNARTAAIRKVPGGIIVEAEIEYEDDNVLVYSFDIEVEGESDRFEVLVDAMTGRVTKERSTDDDEAGDDEDDDGEQGEEGPNR